MVTCCQCGERILLDEKTYLGIEYVEITEISTSEPPIAFDQYPPGDAGLGYACSMKCFQQYVDERDSA